MIDPVELVGAVAGTLTTLAFLPQAWRLYRTRQAADVSLAMYVIFCSGVALWLVYGLLRASWSLVAANGVTLVLAGSVLVLRLIHGRHR